MKKFFGYLMLFLVFFGIFCLLWFAKGIIAAVVVFILTAVLVGIVLLGIELTL
jgi:hypothetical protein